LHNFDSYGYIYYGTGITENEQRNSTEGYHHKLEIIRILIN